MDLFEIKWKTSAKKELRNLDKSVILKILEAVKSLANNPYPHGVKKIQGTEHTYRIRMGDYRVVYSIESSVLLIEIVRVGHRKKIYSRR
jgi:mRNA interferase RelE/StbE